MSSKRNINNIVDNTVWITGSARSGTSILGKILSTLKGAEYAFEPEYLFYILPQIHKLNKKNWISGYRTYLIEELFFNMCLGRRANFKKNEDSFIGNSLSPKNIKKKLKINISRSDFETYLDKNKKKLLIKIPDVSRHLVLLAKYYPKNKFIIISRNNNSIANSLLKKGWFKDKNNLPWIYNSPDILGKNIYKKWLRLDEKERIKLYIKQMDNNFIKIKNKYVVKYENLTKNPNREINKICNFLKLRKTNKTIDIIKTVRKESSKIT